MVKDAGKKTMVKGLEKEAKSFGVITKDSIATMLGDPGWYNPLNKTPEDLETKKFFLYGKASE